MRDRKSLHGHSFFCYNFYVGNAYKLNWQKLGDKVNKDMPKDTALTLFKLHKAGSTHGAGISAARNIYKDEEIIRATGPIVGESVSDTLYYTYGIDVLLQVGFKKWVLPNDAVRFINHSCEPNMGFSEPGVFVAMRHIDEGEDLTFDYATCEINDEKYNWEIDCLCKTPTCRKKISNKDIFKKSLDLVEKYKGYIPKFVLDEIEKRGLS